MSDVNELAIKYANAVDDPENASWHTRYSSFKYAYQKAREDLLRQASEECKLWLDSVINSMIGSTEEEARKNFKDVLTMENIWAQAKLSSLKEIEKLKSQLTEKEALLKEACKYTYWYIETASLLPDVCSDLDEEEIESEQENVRQAREFLAKLKAGGNNG